MKVTASAAPIPIPAFAPVERPEEEELSAGVSVGETEIELAGFAPTAEKEAELEAVVAITETASDVADVGVSVIATTTLSI